MSRLERLVYVLFFRSTPAAPAAASPQISAAPSGQQPQKPAQPPPQPQPPPPPSHPTQSQSQPRATATGTVSASSATTTAAAAGRVTEEVSGNGGGGGCLVCELCRKTKFTEPELAASQTCHMCSLRTCTRCGSRAVRGPSTVRSLLE